MENLFRLALVRPAVAQDPDAPSIPLTQDTTYQKALRDAVNGGTGRQGIEQASRTFTASADFAAEPGSTPLGKQLDTLSGRLDTLLDGDDDDDVPLKSVTDAIKTALGADATAVIKDAKYTDTVRRLRDSVLAIKSLQDQHSRPVEHLTRQLRTAALVADAAAGTIRTQGGGQNPDVDVPALRRRRRRSIALPLDLGLGSRLSTREAERALREQRTAAIAARNEEIAGLLIEHEALRTSVRELSTLESEHYRVSDRTGSTATPAPEDVRFGNVIRAAGNYAAGLRERHLNQLPGIPNPQITADDGESTPPPPGVDTPYAALAQTLVGVPDVVIPGRGAFVPPDLPEVGFVLKESAAGALSEPTRALLAERGLGVGSVPLDRLTHRLEADLASTVHRLETVAGRPERRSLVRFGDALISVRTPVTTGWGELGTGGVVEFPAPLPMDGSVPETKGAVAPAGIADLLLVRQQLTGYEAADVAHIENVLRGERKVREHSRREESELITLAETETSTSEEHELATSDRFEMTRETSQTIREDMTLKAGVTVSGSYGPTVEFAASAEGSVSRGKEEATKAASAFSQDVTERSSRKIAERVLQRTTVRTTSETIEKNTHELNNTAQNAQNISGVYQWVNKRYQAQMFNYGLRAMFDFMVPEPAAFLIAAMDRAHTSVLTLTKPPDFTLLPAQINEGNYGYWATQCGATDVTPPPELFRTKSADFKAGGGDHKTNYNHSAQIAIDDGYRAVFGTIGVVRNVWDITEHSIDLVLGRRTQRMVDGSWLWTTALDDELGSIPLAIDTLRCSQVAVAIEVKCRRTDAALERWRLETHAKLMTAHRAQVADYEEKLAAIKAQAGVAIRGRNPAANQVTIRREMQKNCVSILTDQHFDLFDAVVDAPSNGLPQIDVAEAAIEGAYVRFFEQAFEWENMSWIGYPYFWGSKDQWDERLGYDDADPAFTDFLQAGYARVSVPARPGFEGAIDHFLTFGEIWNGGPLPSISSPLYLPIADEIAERLDRPGAEVPQGDPWPVLIPTNLVRLRTDGALPRWVQNAAGQWVEA